MSALADRFRREGMADAVVLLVLSRTHPTTTAEEWGSILGLEQHEVRAAIERLRARHTLVPSRKQERRSGHGNAGRTMLSLSERRARDARVRQLRAAGESVAMIADTVGLTGSRVRQILAKKVSA